MKKEDEQVFPRIRTLAQLIRTHRDNYGTFVAYCQLVYQGADRQDPVCLVALLAVLLSRGMALDDRRYKGEG